MTHHVSRASVAELRRLNAEQTRSDHAASAVAHTLRIVAQWQAAGLSPRAAHVLAGHRINDLSELRRSTTWAKAPGCGPRLFAEISDFLRCTGGGNDTPPLPISGGYNAVETTTPAFVGRSGVRTGLPDAP